MSTCRSCGAPITWAETVSGKKIPLDEKPTVNGNIIMDCGRAVVVGKDHPDKPHYTSHFATCPNAAKHRRLPK